jgi:hypothetical protein
VLAAYSHHRVVVVPGEVNEPSRPMTIQHFARHEDLTAQKGKSSLISFPFFTDAHIM